MLNGINHITIAVNDLEESFNFYVKILGMVPHAKWFRGAYLSLNELWFCLSLDEASPSKDYSHLAFDVSPSNFSVAKDKILNSGAKQWKQNKSEGNSIYFLDPNSHKLELHVGSLTKRLESLKITPYDGLQFF
ncbi:fosfomycin resistance glutathione transferase [Pseudoalteromonas aurantia]|uniref:Glutathione transferase n=1 Tax=Pseudoalteromonas aurantia TaxID=43654 RepID=A0ABY2W390_9GAMM|nr:fosfomycin resistance glutathione transferase [Pseudoalteromonas aurantia]TMO79001.1 glutathione transferase [Pseudoalteromonas aurantia]